MKWVMLDWGSLQKETSAAASSHTFFAGSTDADGSRVGQLGTLTWFQYLETRCETNAMAGDMPQLSSFTADGPAVGIPADASFSVTTVTTKMIACGILIGNVR